jgi:hypothetical protein
MRHKCTSPAPTPFAVCGNHQFLKNMWRSFHAPRFAAIVSTSVRSLRHRSTCAGAVRSRTAVTMPSAPSDARNALSSSLPPPAILNAVAAAAALLAGDAIEMVLAVEASSSDNMLPSASATRTPATQSDSDDWYMPWPCVQLAIAPPIVW